MSRTQKCSCTPSKTSQFRSSKTSVSAGRVQSCRHSWSGTTKTSTCLMRRKISRKNSRCSTATTSRRRKTRSLSSCPTSLTESRKLSTNNTALSTSWWRRSISSSSARVGSNTAADPQSAEEEIGRKKVNNCLLIKTEKARLLESLKWINTARVQTPTKPLTRTP